MLYIPFLALIVLIIAGLWLGELSWRGAIVVVGIWAGGLSLFNELDWPRVGFVAVEVLLDAVLVLKIFGGDIQIR